MKIARGETIFGVVPEWLAIFSCVPEGKGDFVAGTVYHGINVIEISIVGEQDSA